MKSYLIACMVILLLGGCISSNAGSEQMKRQLNALQENVAKLELSKEQLIQENQSLKQTIELSSSKLINPNYEQIRMDSLNKVKENESSIAHTYQIENFMFISFYEAVGKFLEGTVVTAGGPLVLIEGTYEYLSEDNLLKLTYYDAQTYVYKIQKQKDGLLAECIDAYSLHEATDFTFTPTGIVHFWKKWER